MSQDSEIARNVLADQIKDRLLQGILDGRYAPGSRIIETRVAKEVGTSQAPVREALRGLEALGVVEILPFRGARVRHPTVDELVEAYVVRAELESLAARIAVPQMTDEDLDALAGHVDAMNRAAKQDLRHELAVADAQFHGRIIKIARNATLRRVWSSLEPVSRTYMTVVAPGTDPTWIAELHTPIMDALRRRDPELIEEKLRLHFVHASARFSQGWQDTAGSGRVGGGHP
jgi:DNA-binding GntR family transcriptional regulator